MRSAFLVLMMAAMLPSGAFASKPAHAQAERRPDLADVAAGVYDGDVVADARGSSQSDVVITVTRVSKNLVEVSCDYSRVPTVRIALSRASDAILAAHPGDGFLIEQNKDPKRLDLSIDGATLIVHKR